MCRRRKRISHRQTHFLLMIDITYIYEIYIYIKSGRRCNVNHELSSARALPLGNRSGFSLTFVPRWERITKAFHAPPFPASTTPQYNRGYYIGCLRVSSCTRLLHSNHLRRGVLSRARCRGHKESRSANFRFSRF